MDGGVAMLLHTAMQTISEQNALCHPRPQPTSSSRQQNPAVVQELTDGGVAMLLNHLSLATEAAPKWAKAWHNWALYNVNAMEHYAQRNVEQAQRHVAPAVLGFFRSVALAQAQGGGAMRWWQHVVARAMSLVSRG